MPNTSTSTKGSRPRKRESATPSAAMSSGFRGRAPKRPDEDPKLPVTETSLPSDDFRFCVHPERWSLELVDGKAEILPDLVAVKGRPGLDGVTRRGDVETRLATFRRRGFVEVRDQPVEAFGEELPSYRQQFDLENGDHMWSDVWRRPRMFAGKVRWDQDHAGRLAFRRMLKDTVFGGEVPPDTQRQLMSQLRDLYDTSKDGRAAVREALEKRFEAAKAIA